MQTTIVNCARCGLTHADVDLLPLANHDRFTHYATCPVTNQPIMVQVTSDGSDK
jgi:hypothetical protein